MGSRLIEPLEMDQNPSKMVKKWTFLSNFIAFNEFRPILTNFDQFQSFNQNINPIFNKKKLNNFDIFKHKYVYFNPK